MGFFAVVRPERSSFSVEKLDINLWCLPGLLSSYSLICDVGVRIRAESGVDEIALAVPFGTVDKQLVDLAPVMQRDTETASLVFGEDVSGQVASDSSDFNRLLPVQTEKANRDPDRSYDTFSLWRIPLSRSLESGEVAYVRVRWPVGGAGRVWNWRRGLVRRRGAIADIRVMDLREAAIVRGTAFYAEHSVPVEQLNCFVVTPAHLITRRISPALRYTRLLEGARWERYLTRALDFRRTGKYVVHFWRATNVDHANEFRGFLDFAVESRTRHGWLSVLFLTALTLVSLAHTPEELQASLAARLVALLAASSLVDWLARHIEALLAGGAIGLVLYVFRQASRLRAFGAVTVANLRQLQAMVYRLRMRP